MTEPDAAPVVEPQTEPEVQRDAEAVGAPPYALPESEGGAAAVVGHPDSPATLAKSPVGDDTADPDPEPPALVEPPAVEAPATEV